MRALANAFNQTTLRLSTKEILDRAFWFGGKYGEYLTLSWVFKKIPIEVDQRILDEFCSSSEWCDACLTSNHLSENGINDWEISRCSPAMNFPLCERRIPQSKCFQDEECAQNATCIYDDFYPVWSYDETKSCTCQAGFYGNGSVCYPSN